MNVFVILPAYNESDNLKVLLEKFRSFDYNIIVVDDGSQDGTSTVAVSFKDRLKIVIIKHPKNMGLGAAIRSGFKETLKIAHKDDFVAVMDADNTNSPELIPEMLKKTENSDVVIASRYVPGSELRGVPLFRKILSDVCEMILRILFPVKNVRDYSCGYRLMRVSLLEKVSQMTNNQFFQENGFVCQTEMLLNLNSCGAVFSEVPLNLRYDLKAGKSKIKIFSTIFHYFLLIKRFFFHVSAPQNSHFT